MYEKGKEILENLVVKVKNETAVLFVQNKKISNDGENQWVKLYDHHQDRMGDLVMRLDRLSAGTRADEIMLLRKEQTSAN